MSTASQRLQPTGYHEFHCIGSDCEDTCCSGWIVPVDRLTYEKYQQCEDPELGPRLRELVTISPPPVSDDSYARISMSGPACSFLTGGLCGIQNKLGEEYLGIMCSKYPRVMNVVDGVLQRSLDMSCPEAARVMLLNAQPMEFDEAEGPAHDPRIGHISVLRAEGVSGTKPYLYFHEIRAFSIWLLQYRAFPLWKRLVILASFCDELQKMSEGGQIAEIPAMLEGIRDAVNRDLFGPSLEATSPQPARHLEMVLDWIVARITSDFTPPRFLACYQEFMTGIEWTAQSDMSEIGARYERAFLDDYVPFLKEHEYVFENYLVNYVHSTLFPLGPQETARQVSERHAAHSIREQCLMMMVHYGTIQALLVGQAAIHRGLTTELVIRVVQAYAKAFEHSLTFPGRVLELLGGAGVGNCVTLALLLRN